MRQEFSFGIRGGAHVGLVSKGQVCDLTSSIICKSPVVSVSVFFEVVR